MTKWLTSDIQEAIDFILENELLKPGDKLNATGGGAHKYFELFKEKLGVEMIKNDEMKSLVSGMVAIFEYTDQPSFTYTDNEGRSFISGENEYPKMLVSIGSGVSIIKVNSQDDFRRVSGTMIGGGTLIGLSNILLKVNSFKEIQELCKDSDNSNVDMLIKDLYGDKYEGLEANTIATSFGKIASLSEEELKKKKFNPGDIAASLIAMITFNVAQIAYLWCKLHKWSNIYFVGNFVNNQEFTMNKLSEAFDYWARKEINWLYLSHEGFLGAIGAMLSDKDINEE